MFNNTTKAVNLTANDSISVPSVSTPNIAELIHAVNRIGIDEQVFRLCLAAYASSQWGDANPIWLMLVGAPSTNKTTTVSLFKGDDHIHMIDTMTGNPFVSGQSAKDNPQDLLPMLDKKCFIIKEYGAFFSMADDRVKSLIGEMTAIYDGSYAKHSPMRGTTEFESYFSHIGCVTPEALAKRERYMKQIGARFLMFHLPEKSKAEVKNALENFWDNSFNRKKLNIELKLMTKAFLDNMRSSIPQIPSIEIHPTYQEYLSDAAKFMAHCRGIISTNTEVCYERGTRTTEQVMIDKQVEAPWRALSQLKKLAECLAIVDGRLEVTEDDLKIIRDVVMYSGDLRRSRSLQAFKHKDIITSKEAFELIQEPSERTFRRHFKELEYLGILDAQTAPHGANAYSLKPEFKKLFSTDIPIIEAEQFGAPNPMDDYDDGLLDVYL